MHLTNSVKAELCPTMSWRRQDIINWLDSKGQIVPLGSVKAQLINMVKLIKHRYDRYVIDEYAESHGRTVLRLPPIPLRIESDRVGMGNGEELCEVEQHHLQTRRCTTAAHRRYQSYICRKLGTFRPPYDKRGTKIHGNGPHRRRNDRRKSCGKSSSSELG